MSAAQKNAKIATVNKEIHFSRMEIEWLDTKFEEASVDKIVSQVPKISKHSNPKDIAKLYNEFFYQAKFILKNTGRICIITNKTEELKDAASKYGFKVAHEREIIHGKAVDKAIVFEKSL